MADVARNGWEVGHYMGNRSICVNYYRDGTLLGHYHDYGFSPLSRLARIGYAIARVERQMVAQQHG